MTADFSFTQFTLSDDELRAMLPVLAEPVWQRIARFRNFNHSGKCPRRAARIIAHIERGVDVGTCNPDCVDLFMVTFVHVAHAVAGHSGTIDNVGGFVGRVAERFAQDVLRRERAARGDAAKPMRTDGVNGVIIASLPPGIEAQFLGWMLTDASRNAPVPAEGWNFDYLADRLCEVREGLERSEALRLAREYVPIILHVTRQVAPQGWDIDKFDVPRARRRATYQAIPVLSSARQDDEFGLEIGEGGDAEAEAEAEAAEAAIVAMGDALRRVFRSTLLALGPVKAMRAACEALNPEVNLKQLDNRQLITVAVEFVVEMVLSTATVDRAERRLTRLPNVTEIRRLVEAYCGAEPGTSTMVTEAFLRRVQKALAHPEMPS